MFAAVLPSTGYFGLRVITGTLRSGQLDKAPSGRLLEGVHLLFCPRLSVLTLTPLPL